MNFVLVRCIPSDRGSVRATHVDTSLAKLLWNQYCSNRDKHLLNTRENNKILYEHIFLSIAF